MNPATTVTDLEVWKSKRDVGSKTPAATSRVVAGKRSAGRLELLSGADRWAVVGQMNKAESRGEIRVLRRNPQWNPNTGHYEVVVRRLKEPLPRWVTPTIWIGGAVATLSALALLGIWVATMLGSAMTSVIAVALVAGLFVFIGRGLFSPRGRHGAVDVAVRVRVR